MGWTLFFMLVILKIPLAAALYLVWYAVKEEPEPEESPPSDERHPWRKPPSLPRSPRRGPVGGAGCQPLPCPQVVEDARARRAPAYARRG
jgi:hypothetical protein